MANELKSGIYRRRYLVGLGTGLTAGIAGCSGQEDTDPSTERDEQTSEETSTPGDEMSGGSINVINIDGNFNTLDPLMAETIGDNHTTQSIFSGLFKTAPDFSVEGDVAEDWELEDDTNLRISLRQGVKFHNGDELTSEDVKFSLERILDSESSPHKPAISPISAITVEDDYEVTISLDSPFAPLLSELTKTSAGKIVPKSVVEDRGVDDFGQNPVGSGPFKFVEWRSGDRMVLEKHDEYYEEDKPYLDQVVFQPVTDVSTQLASIEAGDAHIINHSIPQHADSLQDNPEIQYQSGPGGSIAFVSFNKTREPFDNVDLRRAISMGINREELISGVLNGEGEQAVHTVPPTFDWAYNPVEDIPYTRYNPDQAESLLEEIGYQGFEFELMSYPQAPFDSGTELIANQLRDIGLNPDVNIVTVNKLVDSLVNAEYDTSFASYVGHTDPDGLTYQILHSDVPFNRGKWSNEEFDQLVESARETNDIQQRGEYYKQAEAILADQAVNGFVFHFNAGKVLRQEVRGFEFVPAETSMQLDPVYLE